ncbi:MAG TPA: putative lipopolysaccharide heptosyltransferase III [Syntrophales bacterium]|nr:putative lipopolysaccharide heptosyltransferase III [Syntrophales bacterium]HPQ43063.1 putative lipopolysaccharide heptosyltransferase III [Syntrophales bacterium]
MYDTIDAILVIKLRHIGDVVLAIPVFEALRYNYPQAFIAALVNEEAGPVLEHHPSVDRVFTLPRSLRPVHRVIGQLKLIRELRSRRFDLVLELSKSDRGAFYGFVTGAGKRLGFSSKKGKSVDRQLLFTDLVPPSGTQHIVDYHLEMIKKLALKIPGRDITLYWDRIDDDICRRILEGEGITPDDRYVIMHPFSRDGHKSWQVDGYAKICDYMGERWGVKTILIGGNDEVERSSVERVAMTAKSPPVNLSGRLSLSQLAAVSSRALLFMGIDSGPMHVASAVGTPVVAIFGPSRRFRWGPWGENHAVIQKDWPCVPCGKKGCEGTGRSRCLEELSVEEVKTVLDRKMKSILPG